MKRNRDVLVLSNNPLAISILSPHFPFETMVGQSFRDVLVAARDKVHSGHSLLTHPLSGSIKPNETPFKSIAISVKTASPSVEDIEMIGNAIQAFDKFTPRDRIYDEKAIEDFQLIDYTLLAGGLDFDAEAGLNNENKPD